MNQKETIQAHEELEAALADAEQIAGDLHKEGMAVGSIYSNIRAARVGVQGRLKLMPKPEAAPAAKKKN